MAKFHLPKRLMGACVSLLALHAGMGPGAGMRALAADPPTQPILVQETYQESLPTKARYWHLNSLGTVIYNNLSTSHPMPGYGLPPAVYLNLSAYFGSETEEELLRELYPEANLDMTRTGPYDLPPFDHHPWRINSDQRPQYHYSPQVPTLYQNEEPWAELEMYPGGPKVRRIGCALTALCMAAGYSARAPEDLEALKTAGIIDQKSGIVTWARAFNWLLPRGANDGRFIIEAEVLMKPLFSQETNATTITGVHDDDLERVNKLEKILRDRRAMAIIRVPSLSKPNEGGKSHFVLCTGIETDTVDGTPLKRFLIHDPGARFMRRPTPGVTPVRYLDQHRDDRLRTTDFEGGFGRWEIRFFIIPAPAAAAETEVETAQEQQAPQEQETVAETTSQNVSGDFLAWSAPDGMTVFPMLNGAMLDFAGLTLAGKLTSSMDSTEDLDNPNSPVGTASTMSLMGCPAGSYNFLAFDQSGSGVTRQFSVRVGRMGQASAPATYVGEVSGATGMGTLTLSVAAPTETGFQAWLTANTLTGVVETDDPDKDKVPLLLEYAFGLLPQHSDNRPGNWTGGVWTPGMPRAELDTAGGTRMVIGYARRKDDPALSYTAEFSTTPASGGSWVAGEPVSVQSIDTTWEWVKVRSPASPASTRWFGRIRVGN